MIAKVERRHREAAREWLAVARYEEEWLVDRCAQGMADLEAATAHRCWQEGYKAGYEDGVARTPHCAPEPYEGPGPGPGAEDPT